MISRDPEAAANDFYFDTLSLHIYFRAETVREKDFAICSSDELDECHRLMSKLKLAGEQRRSRRLVRSKRRTGRPDLRRTVLDRLIRRADRRASE